VREGIASITTACWLLETRVVLGCLLPGWTGEGVCSAEACTAGVETPVDESTQPRIWVCTWEVAGKQQGAAAWTSTGFESFMVGVERGGVVA
jgi:hypothetical protein